ncbi:vacuolar ATPase assembly integral membrane protein VMA21 homolog [Anoplophora glabripennis]|uniref:vacuolar ATPase assembly integral membrane protein VMA21 homolog n=1 Tax=Anoplophora glabripennis TaxID=217634 RepID=UPI000873C29A|nr:vacuolar ATPase assembly integral membrane protein VMA21 homolog [Anoplophora glabripennis]
MENANVANFVVFKTILLYTTFILAAPITTFFVSKFFIFEGIIGTSDLTGNVWSAVLAVIMLHIALGLYIYKAYYEAEKVKPLEKKD